MKTLGFVMVVAFVVAAIPFEVASFGVALFGSVTATVTLLKLRRAVQRFDASVEELKERLPTED